MAIMFGSAMTENLSVGHIQFNGLINPDTHIVKMLVDLVAQSQEDFKVVLKTADVTDSTGVSDSDVTSVLGETNSTMDITCPGTVTPDENKNISVQPGTFNGTATDSSGLLLPQEDTEGVIDNIALVLKNTDNSQVEVDRTSDDQKQPLDTSGRTSLAYKVAYTKTDTAVTDGTITVYITYIISYE